MKRSIFLLCLLFIGSTAFSQTDKKKTVVATYEGFDGSVYSFIDNQEEYFLFDLVDAAVKKQFNLESEELQYELFKVTYVEVTDEEGDMYLKIVGLAVEAADEGDEDY